MQTHFSYSLCTSDTSCFSSLPFEFTVISYSFVSFVAFNMLVDFDFVRNSFESGFLIGKKKIVK